MTTATGRSSGSSTALGTVGHTLHPQRVDRLCRRLRPDLSLVLVCRGKCPHDKRGVCQRCGADLLRGDPCRAPSPLPFDDCIPF